MTVIKIEFLLYFQEHKLQKLKAFYPSVTVEEKFLWYPDYKVSEELYTKFPLQFPFVFQATVSVTKITLDLIFIFVQLPNFSLKGNR